MTPQEIMNGLAKKNRQLTDKNEEYKLLVEKYATAKRDYNVALAQKMTAFKIDGEKVTLINKLSQGDPIVAGMCYKMDIAEGVMKACLESIKDIRESIGSYRSILTWLRMEKNEGIE